MTKPSYLAVLERPAKTKRLSYMPERVIYFTAWNIMPHSPRKARRR